MSDAAVRTGGCLCGAVRYRVEGGRLRQVMNCHCRQCRRTHGHFAGYSAAPSDAIDLTETRGLKWYASSDRARRGFCQECGGSLFFEPLGSGYLAIAAGTLDDDGVGLETVAHIFCSERGRYYRLDDDLPKFDRFSEGIVRPVQDE